MKLIGIIFELLINRASLCLVVLTVKESTAIYLQYVIANDNDNDYHSVMDVDLTHQSCFLWFFNNDYLP